MRKSSFCDISKWTGESVLASKDICTPTTCGSSYVSLLGDTPKTPDWRGERTAAMAANRNRNYKITIWLPEAELELFGK